MSDKLISNLKLEVEDLVELAIRAGYNNDMPFKGEAIVDTKMQLNLVRFYIVIAEDLARTPIENIMLERFVEIATKHCGHKDSASYVSGGDLRGMMKASAMEVFYTRFAYQIARALA